MCSHVSPCVAMCQTKKLSFYICKTGKNSLTCVKQNQNWSYTCVDMCRNIFFEKTCFRFDSGIESSSSSFLFVGICKYPESRKLLNLLRQEFTYFFGLLLAQ